MKAPRIAVSISEIVTDQPGLSRHALTAALRAAIVEHVAARGPIGPSSSRARASAEVPEGKAGLPQRVARATLKAVQG